MLIHAKGTVFKRGSKTDFYQFMRVRVNLKLYREVILKVHVQGISLNDNCNCRSNESYGAVLSAVVFVSHNHSLK